VTHSVAYVGLGSNVGDRLGHLRAATYLLDTRPERVIAASSVYETEPVGYTDQAWFLNAVIAVRVVSTAPQFHTRLKGIEAEMGRMSRHRWGPREIDLDLLLFGDEVRRDERLITPHPRMHERAFVMAPLVEVAATVQHPILGMSMADILAALDDPAAVRRVFPQTVFLDASQERREA
jgi:2-amino-4-hydroxy-6-hydroxymethyldihydropteridine diphosphokinase